MRGVHREALFGAGSVLPGESSLPDLQPLEWGLPDLLRQL